MADACDPKPIIVVDSAIAFMDGGDGNDASACRKWFAPIRALASSGCTVIVLHHSGKSETSKDYRGSSDFKAAVDVGFLLTNWSSDGRLGMVRLNCWKSRFGFSGELSFHYRRGQFELEESTEAVAETVNEKLISIIRTNPGIKTAEFEKLGMAQGLSRPQCRTFLETGVLRGAIETKRVGTNGRAYYLALETEQPQ